MTKPVTIPNTFATATTAIPLSQLDGDFTAVATAINDANTYSNYAADTGSANAYVVTFSGVSTSYSAGLRIQFKAGNANTGASTINVNAQGAKNITYQDASTLASGAIAVNSIVDVMYDGTQFLLMNDPAGATGGDVTGPASATDNAVVRFDGTTGKLVQNSVVTIADTTGDVAGVGALTASGNLTLSGGTANGVLYLNGSKVATSGSALVFDGTNLGIGTSSPAYKLDVSTASASNFIRTGVTGSNSGAGVIFQGAISGQKNWVIANQYNVNGGLEFTQTTANGGSTIGATPSMVLDSSGNLGLGVTPSAWSFSNTNSAVFQVKNVSFSAIETNDLQATSNAYYVQSAAQWRYISSGVAASNYYQSAGAHVWRTAPSGTAGNAITFSQAMTLDANGRLALGTTSASGLRLTIEDNGNQLRLRNTTTRYRTDYAVNAVGTAEINVYDDSGGVYMPLNFASSIIQFSTGSGSVTERARITSGGYFKASDNGTYAGSALLYHELRQSADAAIGIFQNTNSSLNQTVNGLTLEYTAASPNGTAQYFLYCVDSTALRAGFRSNGGLANYQGNDANLSDERVKTDIKPVGSYWNKIKAIEIVTFKYKDQTHDDDNVGVIAQQVESVAPEFVDVEGFGETPEDGVPLKAIYTTDMYHAAIKALQEAMTRIETLEAKVAQLEGTQP